MAFANETRRFSDGDIKFGTEAIRALAEYYNSAGPIYHPPVNDQSGVVPEFGDNEIIGILGDWGTNLQDAYDILDYLVKVKGATVILHDGDVYYAGFPEEFSKISDKLNELQKDRPNLRYYTIPGNHDYYTFGGPFYESLKKNHLNKSYNQDLALFCLRNKSQTVQFLGLNTGRYDYDFMQVANPFYPGTQVVEQKLQWALKKIN
jgi:3',5'-cyclic AMP phosphodiesterase CpdA